MLEAPGHGEAEDPYFKLEIIDEYGEVVGGKCGDFDFSPENKNIEWQISPVYSAQGAPYYWKDWSSMGVNVMDYHGELIYIRLETRDCLRNGHAGYAYFTLDCIDAAISNNSCGETVTIEMEAPDGFEYIWTNEKDRDVVISTAQKIDVPANDITTYYCEVIYKGLPGCGFESLI